MARDHYEVLGVAPTSEDVVIRAAYRALMRRYHPDAGAAAEMSDRALEINAAYAVLGDPAKRARYDGSLAAAGLIRPNAEPRRALTMPSFPRPSPSATAAFVTLGGLGLILALSPPLAEMPGVPVVLGDSTRPRDAGSSAPGPAEVEPPPPPAPVELATAPATAVEVGPPPAAALVVPDEPPPAPVVVPAPPRQRANVPDAAPAKKAAAETPVVKPAPARPAASKRPTCSYATARTGEAICGSTNLAALDRSLAGFYDQSLSRADDARKASLASTNATFERRRDACRSQSCLTAAYLGRMREVSAIMAKGAQPR